MKTKNIYYTILVFIVFCFSSCKQDDFLNENVKAFLTTDNAYVTFSDFKTAMVEMYSQSRYACFGHYGDNTQVIVMHSGTDMWYDARTSSSTQRFGNYVTALDPQGSIARKQWTRWYKIIANSNTILAKVEESDLSNDEKTLIQAETKFFRGYAYRHLVYLYGGVPLVIEEVNSPKSDFARASKQDILNQIVEDLKFAAANLPDINAVESDGRVSNLVAQHYLAETYLALEEWDKAITAASAVINDPGTALMTSRFGSRKDETPGDVYWDLFRRGNQNRSAGNTEAIWVAQMEVDVPGGFISTSDFATNAFERVYLPASWTLNDPDGLPAIPDATGISDANSGGRGSSLCMPTNYFINDVWQSDFNNDIRNANNNFVRTFIYTNLESAWRDSSGLAYRGTVIDRQAWRWYPWLTKTTTPGNHPESLFEDKSRLTLKVQAGATYRDMYWIRLPETYLLRAEAYLGKNDLPNAASDINVIRARSNATPVASGEVDINYILDERARELSLEEERRLTLMRVGLLVERVRLYNDWNADEIMDYNSLFPIPYSEIEANIYGDLEQNPGYVN